MFSSPMTLPAISGSSDATGPKEEADELPTMRRSSRTHKVHCIVRDCKNDSTSLIDDRPIVMVDIPASHLLKMSWIDMLPEVEYSLESGKVCEIHFLDPTSPVAIPTLHLPAVPLKVKKRPHPDKDSPPKRGRTETSDDDMRTSPKNRRTPPRTVHHSLKHSPSGAGPTDWKTLPLSTEKPAHPSTFYDLPGTSGENMPSKRIGTHRIATPKMIRVVNKMNGRSNTMPTSSNGNVGEDNTKGQIATATITNSKPLDLNELLGLGAGGGSRVSPHESNQSSPEAKGEETKNEGAEVDATVESDSNSSDDIKEIPTTGSERTPVPPTSAPSLFTALSALQQDDAPTSSNALRMEEPEVEPDTEKTSTADGDALVVDSTCNNCLSQLPSIRKSLGRLEMRLDTMVAMVRSLISRQAGSNTSSSGPPRTVTINRAGHVVYKNRGGASYPGPGRPATSNFRFDSSLPSSSSTATRYRLNPPTTSTPPTGVSIASKPITSSLLSVSRGSAKGAEVRRPLFTFKLKPEQATGTKTAGGSVPNILKRAPQLQLKVSKEKEPSVNPDSLVSSLFSASPGAPRPEPVSTDPANVKRRIGRALLLHNGSEFTYGQFMDAAPESIKSCKPSMMEAVIRQLIDDGLFHLEDGDEPLTAHDTLFQKEQAKNHLRALKKYDIKLENYVNRLTWDYEDAEESGAENDKADEGSDK